MSARSQLSKLPGLDQPHMSLQRARELLGAQGTKLTDEEVIGLVDHLELLAQLVVERILDPKSENELGKAKNKSYDGGPSSVLDV